MKPALDGGDWLCGSTTGRESSTCLDGTVDDDEDWQEVVNLGALLASSWTK